MNRSKLIENLGMCGLIYMISLGIVTLITWFVFFTQPGFKGVILLNKYGEVYIELIVHIIGVSFFTLYIYNKLIKYFPHSWIKIRVTPTKKIASISFVLMLLTSCFVVTTNNAIASSPVEGTPELIPPIVPGEETTPKWRTVWPGDSGYINSTSTSYATALSGGGTLTLNKANAWQYYIGQSYSSPTYEVTRTFVTIRTNNWKNISRMDVAYAEFKFKTYGTSNISTTWNLELYSVPEYQPFDTSDWSLSAELLGNISVSGLSDHTVYSIPINVSVIDISDIGNFTGNTTFELRSSREGTAPTMDDYIVIYGDYQSPPADFEPHIWLYEGLGVNRTMSGTILSEDPTYSNALSGSGTLTTPAGVQIGQREGLGTNYEIWRSFLTFNTSFLENYTIFGAWLEGKTTSYNINDGHFDVEIYEVDYGSTLDTSDWNTAVTYQKVHYNTTTTSTNQLHTGIVNASYINKTGYTQYEFRTSQEGTTPPDDTGGSFTGSYKSWQSGGTPYEHWDVPRLLFNLTLTPIADAGINKTGDSVTPITFNGTGSYDPDGTIANYTWNISMNGTWFEVYGVTPSFTFWNVSGSPFTVNLTVTDNEGATDSDSLTVIIQQGYRSIRINSDSDFTIQNGVTSGSGTSGDPYIINNLTINATGYGSGIFVGNTTKHFIIRNCTLFNATGFSITQYFYNSGIYIHNTTNGTVINNTINNNRYGIFLQSIVEKGHNITIISNDITQNSGDGIFIFNMDNITIITNNITHNLVYGIYSDGSSGSNITTNNVHHNTKSGLDVRTSIYNNISQNNIYSNGEKGCTIASYQYGNITNNSIYNNNQEGVYLFGFSDSNLILNNITNNSHGIFLFSTTTPSQIKLNNVINNTYGINITSSANNNYIYHNNFINNTNQVTDLGSNNIWDIGHQFGGNYYDDLITTDLYHGINQNISGADNLNDTSFLNDNYPLVNPFETNNTPVADAGIDQYYIGNHEMNATNSSDAGGTSLNYTWNFTYSATPYTFYGINFSFNFAIQGNYEITLNVTDDDSNLDQDTMIVYAQPLTANAGADDSVYRSVSYQFDASGTYGVITNYTWNFTHNATSEILYGEKPSFTFWQIGIFNVTLNVTDIFSSTDEDWVDINVTNHPPNANAGIDQAGLKGIYTLNGSATSDPDGVITNYTWNFTYNAIPQTLYLTYPTFNFQILGNYLITLNVSDDDSGTDEDTTWVNVTNANPVANAGTDIIGKRLIAFDGSLSSDVDGSIVNFTWNFTDSGTPVTLWGVSPSYDFNISQAPIIVTLNVTDDEGGTDEDTVQVTLVFLLPIADAGADQGTNKGTFILDGSGSSDPDGSIINWTWTFTYDGSPETLWGEQPNFDFLLEVDTEITLNVTDDDWRYDEDTTWVNITYKYPVASFSIYPSGTNKGSRLMDGLLSTDEDGTIDNYTYEWEYNSTTHYRYVPTFSFDFLLEGTYNITLNITDDNGLQDETYHEFSIIFKDPVAVIENRTTALMFNDITFDGSESTDEDGYIVNYTWNFTYNEMNYTFYGDNFTFRFSEVEGNVTLTLNVTDDDGRYNTTTITFEVQNPMRLLTDLLILLIPLFIILLIVILVIAYVKKTTRNAGDG